MLFAPTILLNSAFWGQSESTFTAFLLLCIYFLMAEPSNLACLAFGVTFAFKLQAIFLAPLLVALVNKGWLASHSRRSGVPGQSIG